MLKLICSGVLLFTVLAGLKGAGNSILEDIEKLERFIEVNPVKKVDEKYRNFLTQYGIDTLAVNLKDGVFRGESVYDNFKYRHVVEIKVKRGKIVSVTYDELKRSGKGKTTDREYCMKMKKGSGASPADVYPLYAKMLVDRGDLNKVDAVSGATYSLYRFRIAAIRAFLKARVGKKNLSEK